MLEAPKGCSSSSEAFTTGQDTYSQSIERVRFRSDIGVTLNLPILNVGSTHIVMNSASSQEKRSKSFNCLSVAKTINGSGNCFISRIINLNSF